MNHIKDIIHRLRCGESERQISRDLGISRPTVHKYKLIATTEGFLDIDKKSLDLDRLAEVVGPTPSPPKTPSSLEPYKEVVGQMIEQGIEMTAMWQRLRSDHGYTGSYSSVRRFVHRHHFLKPRDKAVIRVHSEPGEEMQVDFGNVGKLYDPASGRLRTAYVFVATLCYSRHQYAELVFDQKTATWIGLHRRAFQHFGGVPKRVKPDNLKAAVSKALVHDPVLGEAYRQMAIHYGFLVSPTAPAQPQQKGKVENGIHYVKRNFMAGQMFADIHFANQHLMEWVREVAGVRRHGTTHQAPLYLFETYERSALQPLPDEPFTLLETRTVKVHPDCHVVIDSRYYSVPYIWIEHELEAYIHERMVEIYADQKLIATHIKLHNRGQWSTRMSDYPPHKAEYLTKVPAYCCKVATRIGPATRQVVDHLLTDKPYYRLRSVQAILRLEDTVGSQRLEDACKRAVHYGDMRYRRIKDILNAALDRQPLPEPPVKTSQSDYAFARNTVEFFTQTEEEQS
ncbi:MAG: IS21 family transposase [Anaerolineales bacterium]